MKCATRQDESGWVVVNVKSAYLCGEKNELTKTEDMANNKTTMTDLRIIISELAKGTSKRKISRDLHISRTSIDVYEKRAEESEYTYAVSIRWTPCCPARFFTVNLHHQNPPSLSTMLKCAGRFI